MRADRQQNHGPCTSVQKVHPCGVDKHCYTEHCRGTRGMIPELQACMDMPAMLPPLEDENTFSNHSGLTCFFGRGSLLMGGQKTVHSFDYGGHLFRVTFFLGHRLQLSPAFRFAG